MKTFKRIISLVLTLAAVFAIAAPALAYTKSAYSGTRYIYASNGVPVNVRTGPGTSYAKTSFGTFNIGTKVILEYVVAGSSDDTTWYECYNSANSNQRGWVRGDFLSVSSSGGGSSPSNAWESEYGSGTITTSSTGGASKPQIMHLQEDLIVLGFSCGSAGADGNYGNGTKGAVEAFQRAYGLTVDGMAGPATKSKLYSVINNRG